MKNWLAEFDKSNKLPANENSIELKPIYLSLFGLREISDIKSAIDRCVNPFFYSKAGKMLNIDYGSYPNHSSSFRMRPIFAKENPHQLFESLCKMSNRGRNSFSQFLAYHYEFHVNCDFSDTFLPDHDVLVKLRDFVKEEAKSKVSIEKWSYDGLIEGLDKSIRRANGESRIE